MLDKARLGVALLFIAMFVVSVFTRFPTDPGTRTILGTLALAAAGFLFGPTFLKRRNGA